MKPFNAGLVAALGAILFFSGCAQPIGGGGKPNVLRITLPEKADHATTLNLIVGEFVAVTKEKDGKTRTLTLADRKAISFSTTVVVPVGQKSVEIPIKINGPHAAGREFIVVAFEEKKDGRHAPMVGVTTLRVNNKGELVSLGGIHIGPGPH